MNEPTHKGLSRMPAAQPALPHAGVTWWTQAWRTLWRDARAGAALAGGGRRFGRGCAELGQLFG